MKSVLNHIKKYRNIKIYQSPKMFNYSIDTTWLANFYGKQKFKKILEVGGNNAALSIFVAEQNKNTKNLKIDIVEIQEEACALARKNIKINNMQNIINVFHNDFKIFKNYNGIKYDAILCNPPFFKVNEKSNLTKKSDFILHARHETLIDFETIIRISRKIIKNKGYIFIVHRTERLDEVINTLYKHNFFIKEIKFIYPNRKKISQSFLVKACFQGNMGVLVDQPIFIEE